MLGSRSRQDELSRRPSLVGITAVEQFDKAALANFCVASSLHHCCSLLDLSVCGLCGVQTQCGMRTEDFMTHTAVSNGLGAHLKVSSWQCCSAAS